MQTDNAQHIANPWIICLHSANKRSIKQCKSIKKLQTLMSRTSPHLLALPARPKVEKRHRASAQTLAFRVTDDIGGRVERAAAVAGISVSDFLRNVLLDHFDRTQGLLEQVEEMQTAVASLHESLAVAVEAILVTATNGTKISKNEAREWVDENLRRGHRR
jgi:uncharacterized protein (DUF1778 family)